MSALIPNHDKLLDDPKDRREYRPNCDDDNEHDDCADPGCLCSCHVTVDDGLYPDDESRDEHLYDD